MHCLNIDWQITVLFQSWQTIFDIPWPHFTHLTGNKRCSVNAKMLETLATVNKEIIWQSSTTLRVKVMTTINERRICLIGNNIV